MKKIISSFIVCLTMVLISCTNYGERVSKGESEVFYDEGATKEEATKLMDYLFEIQFLDENQHISAQLLKSGDTYQVKLVIKDEFIKDESKAPLFLEMKETISSTLFDGAPVEIHLCNDKLESQKKY